MSEGWISEVKKRLRLITIGDGTPGGGMPDWPVLPEGYEVIKVSPAMVSFDGIHWYEKPDDVPLAEFLAAFQPPSGSG